MGITCCSPDTLSSSFSWSEQIDSNRYIDQVTNQHSHTLVITLQLIMERTTEEPNGYNDSHKAGEGQSLPFSNGIMQLPQGRFLRRIIVLLSMMLLVVLFSTICHMETYQHNIATQVTGSSTNTHTTNERFNERTIQHHNVHAQCT